MGWGEGECPRRRQLFCTRHENREGAGDRVYARYLRDVRHQKQHEGPEIQEQETRKRETGSRNAHVHFSRHTQQRRIIDLAFTSRLKSFLGSHQSSTGTHSGRPSTQAYLDSRVAVPSASHCRLLSSSLVVACLTLLRSFLPSCLYWCH